MGVTMRPSGTEMDMIFLHDWVDERDRGRRAGARGQTDAEQYHVITAVNQYAYLYANERSATYCISRDNIIQMRHPNIAITLVSY